MDLKRRAEEKAARRFILFGGTEIGKRKLEIGKRNLKLAVV
jgi:hypothetical protein